MRCSAGKRQLNQLMTFLDNKGGSLKEGVSGSRGDAAIRSVRAKREADEAGELKYGQRIQLLTSLDRQTRSIERVFTG